MVREIDTGVFGCERFGCTETFGAENEARLHERRNAPHIGILDLSTLPPNTTRASILRRGFVVALRTLRGFARLSSDVHSGEQSAAQEVPFYVEIAANADLTRTENPRGRRRIKNSTPATTGSS